MGSTLRARHWQYVQRADWLMARSALAAKMGPAEHDDEFLADKVVTARFYGEHLLPQANGLIPTIKGGNALLAEARL